MTAKDPPYPIRLPRLSERPLVSIIVPSFNQGAYIRETLDSILSQNYRPLEVIVIDGASTDDTIEILHQYDHVPELAWHSEPDRGVVEAVNKGFRKALGEIGAIQSSDDFYLPGAVAEAVKALQDGPNIGIVYGDIIKVDAEGRELSRTFLSPFTIEGFLSLETWIPQPAAFFRLQVAKDFAGWREEVPYAADTDLWLRMMFRVGVRKLDVLMAKRRMHGEQRDRRGNRIIRDYARMIHTSPEVRAAARRVRRAAAAGKLLLANRYGYGDSYLTKFVRQWRAALIYPRLLLRFPASTFLPGWAPFRSLLSRVRRSC